MKIKHFLLKIAIFWLMPSAWGQQDSSAQAEKLMQAAIAHFDGRRYEQALESLNQSIQLNNYPPFWDILYYYRGVVYTQLGKSELALADLDKAIGYAGGQKPHYIALRGRLYFEKAAYELARVDLEKALELDPKQPECWLWLAAIDLKNANTERGLTRLNQSISLDPNQAEAYYYRGFAHFELLNPAQGCADWRRAQALGRVGMEALLGYYCK